MYFFNQIISGGPGLFFVAVLWTIVLCTFKNDLHIPWSPIYYLFHKQRTNNPYKQDKVLAKGQFLNSPAGPSLSPAFNLPGLTPVVKSNRPDFHALFSGSVQKAGLLLGIFILLSFGQLLAATISSTGNGGNWSNGSTWVGGVIPANGDNVSVPAGSKVIIDANPTVGSLSISGTLEFEANTPRAITVVNQVTISSGGVFQSAQSGAVKNHQLIIKGSIINDGILDFSSNSNATGVEIVFTGSSNATFNCSDSPLTNLRSTNGIILDKGTSAASVLSFTPGNKFQVLSDGSSNAKGFLSVINGTFNIIGSNRFSNAVFTAEGNYTIPGTGGFWLGNQNATVIGMNGTVTNRGDLRITNGTFNVGISGGSSLETLAEGQFRMSGGTLNIAGSFKMDGGNATLSGGRINLATQAGSADQEPTLSMSGQTRLELYGDPIIVIANPHSKEVPVNDIQIEVGSGLKSATGGAIQLGTEVTPSGSSFFVNGDPVLSRLTVLNECAILVFNTSKSDLATTPISALPKIAFDKIAPELTAPPKITVQCGETLPKIYASLQEVTKAGGAATDNCTLVPASFKLLGQIQSSVNCPYTITRTYEISDVSGNVATAEHLIIVEGGAVETPTETIAESSVKEELKLKSAMAGATITSTTTGGNWNSTSSWSGGVIPTAGDNAVIVTGATVTVNAASSCDNITIDVGGTLNYSGTNTLTVNGNWINNGTYDAGTNGIVEFAGTNAATIGGNNLTTFKQFIINKSASSTVVQVIKSIELDGDIFLTTGLLQINNGISVTCTHNSGFTIQTDAGLRILGTFTSGAFSIDNKGVFEVDGGTANLGTIAGNSLTIMSSGDFTLKNSGQINIAGRLELSGGDAVISGGTLNINTVGNNSASPSFYLSPTSTINMSGGNIVFQNPNGSGNLDMFIETGGTKTFTSGNVTFGGTAGTYRISSEINPFPSIINAAAGANLILKLFVTSSGTYNFPLVDQSGAAIPATVTLSGTPAANAFIQIETTGSKHSENKSAVNYLNRYWTATTSGIANYNVTATYANADVPVTATETEIAMGNWTGALPWIKGSDVNAGSNTISKTGITSTSFVFTGITSDPPTVTITNGPSVAICNGSSLNLTATATGDPTLTYSWSPATGLSATNISNPTATPASTTTYTVTVTDGNGFTATDVITVTVNPLPVAPTATASQAFCGSATIADLSATPPGGSTVKWYAAISGGSALAVGTALTSGTTYYAESENTTTLCVSASRTAVAVTIKPTPTATISGTIAVCQNATNPTVTIINPMSLAVAVTYDINGAGTTTVNVGANSSLPVSQPTTAAGVFNYNLISVAYQTAPTCSNPVSGTATITVNPTPTVNVLANQTYCNSFFTSAIVPSGPVAGTTYAWTNSNTSIGLAASGTGNIPQFITTNGTSAPISGTITVTPTANGCPGPPLTYTITVNPTLTASIGGSTSVCQNDASPNITFTNPLSLPVTVTYRRNSFVQPTINVSANNTAVVAVPTNTAVTYTYELVSVAFQSNPTCLSGVSGSATVIVNPRANTVPTPAAQTICSTKTITPIILSSSTTGVTFNWARDHVAEVTGIAASGSGDIYGTLTNTTSFPVVVTFTIKANAGGCDGTPAIATVTVNPTPIATVNPPLQTRCSGIEAISEILPSSTTPGTTYTWTRDHVAEVTGIAASGIGPVPIVTLKNTTNAPVTVTFTFTPRANNCDGPPVTAAAVINPTPDIRDLTENICNSGSINVSPVNAVDGVVPSGTNYSWAIQSSTGGITGASSGSGTSITGTFGNTTNSIQTVTYAVTPSFAGCIGKIFLLVINVTPAPAINPMTRTICSGGSFTANPVNVTNGTVPVGTTYSWSAPTVTGGITGGVAGSGATISGTLTNPTNTIQTATYRVSPSSGGSCPGTTFTVTVTVQPAPAIYPMTRTICSGGSFTATPVDGTNGLVPAGTSYSWSAPAVTGGITGGTAGSGSANISGTLFNPTNSTQTATYTVTPSSGGCAGTPFTITVTVDPTPSVNPMTAIICSGGSFTAIPVNVTNGLVPAGTTYSWSAPSVTGGITGGVAGSGATISGTLINPTNSVQTATYTVIPTSGSCSGIIFSVIVTVNPAPSINPIPATVCNGTAFTITPANGTNGTVPAGTTYSWPVPTVTGSMTGGATGSGAATISGTLTNPTTSAQTAIYTVTPATGSCTGNPFAVTVTVNPTLTASISGTTSVCYNVGSPTITFTNPQSLPVTVTYNINGASNQTVDIAGSSFTNVPAIVNLEGTFNYNLVSVAYQSAPTCPTTITGTATVTVKPISTAVISAAPAGAICSGTPVTFTATVANAGTNPNYQWYIGTTPVGTNTLTFTSTTLANTDKITVVVTTNDTPCPGPTTSNMITMTVNPSVTPSVTIYESANPVCVGTSVTFTANPPVNGGTSPGFQWKVNGVNAGTNSTYSYTPANNDVVKVELTSNANCAINPATSNTVTMTVNSTPTASVSGTTTVCQNAVSPNITFTNPQGLPITITYNINGGTSASINVSANNTATMAAPTTIAGTYIYNLVSVAYQSSPACSTAITGSATVTVNPSLPASVSIAASANPVCEGTAVTFTATPTNGGTTPAYQWKVNGVNAGTNSSTHSYTPANNDIVTVILTSNATCATGSPATSNAVTMTVNPNLPVSVTIAASANSVCAGTSVTFTATPVNGGTTPAYQWKVNGVNAGTNSSTYSYTPVNNDVVTVLLTSDSPCAAGSPATSNAVAMTVNPNLPVSVTIAASANPVCAGTSVTFTATPTNGGTTPAYQWKVNGVNAGINSSTYTYTPASSDVVTVVLTSNSTCATGNPATSNAVTVSPGIPATPGVITGASEQCVSRTGLIYSIAPVSNATSYSWAVPSGWTITSGAGTRTITVSTGAGAVSGNITVTATNSCGSSSNSLTVTVSPAAPVAPGIPTGAPSFCPPANGLIFSVPAVSNATSYIWTLPSPGWTIVSGNGTNSITVNVGSTANSGLQTISVRASNACGTSSASPNLNVTVGTFPFVDAGPDIFVCAGSTTVNYTSPPGGATSGINDVQWTSSGSGSFTNSGRRANGTYTFSAADIAAGSVTLTITSAPEGDCIPAFVTDQVKVTIIPNPTVNAGGPNAVCQSATPSAITLTGASVGGGGGLTTGSWSIVSGGGSLSTSTYTATPASVTYTPLANFSGTVTLRLTTNTPGGCTAVIASRAITVNPAPTVNAGGPNTVCQSATPSAITLTGASIGGGASTGTWTITGGGGTLSSILPTATPATVTYTPAANFSGTVTLTLTTNAPSGCSAVSATRIITVNPAPTVNAGGTNVACQSATPSAITLSGASVGGGATTGAWSITSGGGSLSSLLQTATPATVTYTPTANFSGTVTLTLTTNDPDGAGPCNAVSSTRIITVNASPTVNAGGPDVACQSATPSTITLSGATVGGGATTGAWSINSGGGSLSSLLQTATPATVTYTPAANFTGTVILTLTTDAPGICPAVSATRTITVNAAPTVNAGGPNVTCQSASPSPITLTGASVGGGATTGAWSIVSGGGTLSTLAQTATPATVTYTPAANFSGTVTLTLTTNAPSGCSSASATRTITVNAAPTVSAGPAQTICSGSSVTLAGTVGGGATTGTWTGGAGTFNPDRNTLNATYTPSGAEIAAGTVNLTLSTTDPSGTCGTVSAAIAITISKAVVILTQPVNTGVCAGSVADLSVVADGTNLTYLWYKDGVSIPGATSSTLHFNSVSLTDNGSYSVTVSGASPCPSVISNAVTLNVDAAITISTQPVVSQTKCTGDNVTFSVAASANGVPLTYQWRKGGVDISGATLSSYTITGVATTDAENYDVLITGQAGFTCATATSTVASLQVSAAGTISLSGGSQSTTVCVNNPILTPVTYSIGGSATSATWTGSLPAGVTGSYNVGVYTISGIPTETGTFNYTVTTTGSACSNPSLSGTITVDGVGTISLAGGNATPVVCINNPLPTITYAIGGTATNATITPALPAGLVGSYSNGLFTISGTPTASGTYTFTVSTTGSACVNPSLSGVITVTNDATITLSGGNQNQAVCFGSPITPITYTIGGSATGVALLGQLPAGVTGSYSGGIYTISGTPTVPGTFNYTVTTTGPCSNNSVNGTITVNYYPDGGFISPSISTACTATNSGTLTLESYVGTVSQWQMSLDGGNTWTVIPNTANTNTYTYTNLPNTTLFTALVGNANCFSAYSGIARVTVIPEFKPVITASGGDICSGEPVTLTGTIPEFNFDVNVILGGDFNQANLHTIGWNVYKDGVMDNNFPANNNNEKIFPWAETNGPKHFCNGNVFDSGDNKFAVVNGGVNSWMETPVFNLASTMSSAELTFTHAYMLDANATARIMLSTDGGNTYTIQLASYSGNLMSGNPNVINDVGIDLTTYIGTNNLRIRFEFDSPSECSVWAVDNVSLPTPPPDITYQWGPIDQIPLGGGEVVVVLPPTTTDYTLTVYIAGCPGSADYHRVIVVNNPIVTASNACVGGGPVTFAHANAPDGGTWSVTGGGTINSAGEFTATDPGCFVATYTTQSGGCSGSASFVVFPAAPAPTVNTGCGPIVVTPPPAVYGFDVEYSFDDGGTWGANTPPTAENCNGYHIRTRYKMTVACDLSPVGEISSDPVCSVSPDFVRIIDSSEPTFTVPADITISKDANCNYDASITVTGDVADEYDNCSTGLEATYSDVVIPGVCEGEEIIERTWILEDGCGNQTVHIQTITAADDNLGPTFTVPSDITINKDAACNYDASVGKTGDVTDESDNCDNGPLEAVYSDAIDNSGLCALIITRTWSLTDDCGNTATQTQIITVTDNNKPVITCPAAAFGTTDADDCFSTNVVLGTATATGNCSTVTVTNNAPAQFSAGVTTVIWTATDACGNVATCTQIVTVSDINQPPTIACPANIRQPKLDANCDPLVVAINPPVATDNCAITNQTWIMTGATNDASPATGTYTLTSHAFNIGVTSITYTVTDPFGNTVSCTFTVTIDDISFPVVQTCPGDMNASTDANECYATLSIGKPTAFDPCGQTFTITHNSPYSTGGNLFDASGQYPAGTTTITWQITDTSSNTSTCTQVITVTSPPMILRCPGNITEPKLDANCDPINVTPGAPSVTTNCTLIEQTWIMSGATTDTSSSTGINVLGTHLFNVGVTTVEYTVRDQGGRTASCSFTVTIDDISFPVVQTCPGDMSASTDANECYATLSIGKPTAFDPCGQTFTITHNSPYSTGGNLFDASGQYPAGTTTITWMITDSSSNTTTCTQVITVTSPPMTLSCPTSITQPKLDANCDPISVTPGPPSVITNCTLIEQTWIMSGATTDTSSSTGINVLGTHLFNVGVTTVEYTVRDQGGRTASCSFTVTINDITFPVVQTCPGDMSASTDANECYATLSIGKPTAFDPCGQTFTITHNSPYSTGGNLFDASGQYPAGTTTITWMITDSSSNTTTCTQVITVTSPPMTLSCPTSITQPKLDANCDPISVTPGPPSVITNCTLIEQTWIMSGATTDTSSSTGINVLGTHLFNVGVTTVEYTVRDQGGRTTSCSFTVTINDITFPVVQSCPGDVTTSTGPGNCDIYLTLDKPTATDLCGQTFTITHSSLYSTNGDLYDASGIYPIGVTTIIWTITDESLNATTCTQVITVSGVPPAIDCPDDITAPADFEKTYKEFVDVDPPVVTLSCPLESLTWIMAGATTDTSSATGTNTLTTHSFNLGVTSVTYTVTDDHGLSASCTFTVTIFGKPIIDCPADIVTNTTVSDCTSTLDPGVPVLRSGSPLATSWIWVMTGATTGSGGNNGSDPLPISPNPFTFNEGVTTITWTACNISGCSTPCTQEITVIDKEPPTFTPVTITECVDLLVSAVYSATSPNPNSGIDPNLIIVPSPDYYTFKAGNITLDLTDLDDNCCGTASLTVNWRIKFTDVPNPLNPAGPALTHADIIGTGQPSDYIDAVSGLPADIYMWGDGVNFTTVTHSIYYWVEDCHGNTSEEQRGEINVTPRPEIIKMN